ncbi:syntaxin-23-like [Arachis ipaensis]|uniref:syntaxin-23-like n=1 Tax=Arachis ipaensis TaxID=130454 RepID=UPI0007AF2385|nr:syntaxin-23-like [Arachis ipaensis]XP_025653241.1 syntaxin-23-like [Arachis hypogaea]
MNRVAERMNRALKDMVFVSIIVQDTVIVQEHNKNPTVDPVTVQENNENIVVAQDAATAVLKKFQKAQRPAVERETAYTEPHLFHKLLHSAIQLMKQMLILVRLQNSVPFLWNSKGLKEVLFLDNEIVFNETIIEEREHGIQAIQQQIGEVNEIFKDLAVLVHEQGTMIGLVVI